MARRNKGRNRKRHGKRQNIASTGARAPAAVTTPPPAPAAETAPTPRSPAQKRAEDALRKVQDLDGQEHGNYASYVKALPARIIMNGLGQALAMEKSGAGNDAGHRLLYDHLQNWLLNGWEHSPYGGRSDILEALVNGSEADYIRAQGEAMAFLEWLKKFAQAFLKDAAPAGDGGGGDAQTPS